MGTLRWTSSTAGDESLEWDPGDASSVKAARSKFDELRKKGMNAYKVESKAHRTGSPITEFDPDAGELLFTAPSSGG